MGPIDRIGTFRGTPTEWAVGKTKNEYPQFVVRLMATEKWIESTEEMEAFKLTEPGWLSWSEYEQSIVAYLVLFNNDGPIFNYDQVQTALGWDGASFSGLAEMDHAGKTVLFRIEENTYGGTTRLQVAWIDEKDAPIERTLRALDPDKLRDLDSKYAGMLNTKKVTPASFQAPENRAAPKATSPAPPAGRPTPSPSTATIPPTGSGQPTGSKTPPTTGPPADEAPPANLPPAETCTMDEAWIAIQHAAKDDDKAASIWVEAAEAVGIENQESATNGDWANVRAKGLTMIAA